MAGNPKDNENQVQDNLNENEVEVNDNTQPQGEQIQDGGATDNNNQPQEEPVQEASVGNNDNPQSQNEAAASNNAPASNPTENERKQSEPMPVAPVPEEPKPDPLLDEAVRDQMIADYLDMISTHKIAVPEGSDAAYIADAMQPILREQLLEKAGLGAKLNVATHAYTRPSEFPSPMSAKDEIILESMDDTFEFGYLQDYMNLPRNLKIPQANGGGDVELTQTISKRWFGSALSAMIMGIADYYERYSKQDMDAFFCNPADADAMDPGFKRQIDRVTALFRKKLTGEELAQRDSEMLNYYYNAGLKVMERELMKEPDLNSPFAHHLSNALGHCMEMNATRAQTTEQLAKDSTSETLKTSMKHFSMMPNVGDYVPSKEVTMLLKIQTDIQNGTVRNAYSSPIISIQKRKTSSELEKLEEVMSNIVCGQTALDTLSQLGTTVEDRKANLNKFESTYNSMQAGIRNHVKENLQTYKDNADSRLPALNGGIKNDYFAKTAGGKNLAQQDQPSNQPTVNAQPQIQQPQQQPNPAGF